MATAEHITKDPLKTHEAPRPSFGRRGLDLHMIDPGFGPDVTTSTCCSRNCVGAPGTAGVEEETNEL